MQTVNAAFTAEEKDTVRKIVQNLQISWHKQSTLSNRTFTIGVSLIGGNDVVGINPGAIGSPSNYKYFDETNYTQGLTWERGLNMPTGGLSMANAEIVLDNTSGRFTPKYMGGKSELFTAILPRKPVIINLGLNVGIDYTLPQFVGVISEQPEVSVRNKQVHIRVNDYNDYFQNRYLDQVVMFTSQRTDQVLTTLMNQSGMSTAQYDLDMGINTIPFGMFDVGTKFSDIIHQLVEAENGHFYQDEFGIFKFENRQHWSNAPYNAVQKVIYTSQVIDAQAPNQSHLINVVEINGGVYQKQPLQTVFSLPLTSPIMIPGNSSIDQFFEFQDPILSLTMPTNGGTDSYFIANTQPDASGTDMTGSLTFSSLGLFAKSVKLHIVNSSMSVVYLTQLVLAGRVAKRVSDLYYREQDDSSVTAYQEQVLGVNNEYIQNPTWAKTYAGMLLNDFSEVEKIQVITIRGMQELQLGDLTSWQGRYWRIFDIKTTVDPSAGFIQELTMIQRDIITYFRIGISTIGGGDRISP